MKKNKKQRRIMLLLILILGITIGFALLSTTLKINGTAGIKGNTWDIHWDDNSINVTSGSVSASAPEVSTATTAKDTVSFDVEFELPGDFYEFEIDAVNEGTVDGALDLAQNWITYTINNQSASLPSYMDFKVTYDDDSIPQSGDILSKRVDANTPGRQTYKIRVEFKSSIEELPSNPQPVTITVELPYVQSKESAAYVPYELGDVVYFDPISTNKCDSSTFSIDAINNGTSTCYKWNVITMDDAENKTDIELQLDHNIINVTYWTDINSNSKGPNSVLADLETSTSSWTRVPLLNYTYDTTDNGSYNYGLLSCVNGVCSITKNSTTTTYASNVRARIITGEEIRSFAMHEGAAIGSNADVWTPASNGGTLFAIAYHLTNMGTMSGGDTGDSLAWAIQNTDPTSSNYATSNAYGANNYGYWSLTPATISSTAAWYLNCVGIYMQTVNPFVDGPNNFGLRPVVNVPKSMITKG